MSHIHRPRVHLYGDAIEFFLGEHVNPERDELLRWREKDACVAGKTEFRFSETREVWPKTNI